MSFRLHEKARYLGFGDWWILRSFRTKLQSEGGETQVPDSDHGLSQYRVTDMATHYYQVGH